MSPVPAFLPFSVLLNNIRSLYNVGSIFRTADGVGVEKLWLCGITGIPPDPKISKTALGAEKTVAWEFSETPLVVIEKLRRSGYQIVLLEQTERSVAYDEFEPKSPFCLVVGNEVKGVGEELLPRCDAAVEIPMARHKHSLNVAAAFAVAAFHFRGRLLHAKASARLL